MSAPRPERSSRHLLLRAFLFAAGSALGTFAAGSATAQDTPPAEAPAPPAEAPAPPPPAEAPPPAAPPPAAPPVAAPPKQPAAAPVTLEETPEEPPTAAPPGPGGKPTKKKHRRPKPERAAPPPEAAPPPTAEAKPEPKAEPKPAKDAAGADEDGGDAEEGDENKAKGEKDDDGDGVFGPFRIGGLVGVGLPSIITFGGIIKLTRYFGAGLNIGLIPAIKVSFYGDAELSYQEYDLYGRLFPFGGDLFAGAGVGYATMEGKFKSKYNLAPYKASLPPAQAALAAQLPDRLAISSAGSVRTLVLTPTIGLLHVFGSGFTLGVDVGAQVPIAPSKTKYKTTVDDLPPQLQQEITRKYITPNDKKVKDTLDTVGRTILPTLNLRLGFLNLATASRERATA